jgi:sugar fermentation stimulation protein A
METPVRLFRNDREALFVERPNRFLIVAKDGKTRLLCHCPDPGRLGEFFGYQDIPGARLILERREAGSGAKTDWTAAALYYRDGVVPLFPARANRAAEKLILPRIIPGIHDIQAEFRLGNSRFDFLCACRDGKRHIVEVKACSLVEYGAALFPDAPSERALKHLKELAALHDLGYICHIVFVIVHGEAGVFIPNLHTDPEFAAALGVYGGGPGRPGPVRVHACSIRCDSGGTAYLARAEVPVDLSHGKLAESDRGSYLITLEIPRTRNIETGALGTLRYEAGWYVYAGSAQKNLSRRVSRHLRRFRKKRRWHIDYLGPHAAQVRAWPVCSYRNLECDLAGALESMGGRGIPGFGSSDCRCKSHLFYFQAPPLKNPAFLDLLSRFRHVMAFEQAGS